MKKLILVILILAFIVVFAGYAFADDMPKVTTRNTIVNIVGKLDEFSDNVTLTILNDKNVRLYSEQVKTDKNGNYKFDLCLNYGNYKGKISSYSVRHIITFTVRMSTSCKDKLSEKDTEIKKEFIDINNNWARDEIESLIRDDIIPEVSENIFMPDKKVTRTEFAVMIFNYLKLKSKSYSGKFMDVQESDWFFPYVEALADVGVVIGNKECFYPDDELTREQMAVMVVRILKLRGMDLMSRGESFDDKLGISSWAADSVLKALNNGIIFGMTDTMFKPKSIVTRGQAAAVIYRLKTISENITE